MADLEALQSETTSWRRELRRNPEFGFEALRTAAFVAAKLEEFGLDKVVEGAGGAGVVASLSCGCAARSIALRADMDALRIEERSDGEHKSQSRGVMHACGYDSYMAMLLGAAKLLGSTR
jgi:hippurate hydrolase